jgi:hypothetical protein
MDSERSIQLVFERLHCKTNQNRIITADNLQEIMGGNDRGIETIV